MCSFKCLLHFSPQVTIAIINGISGSDEIFGGDLSVVVNLLEPMLRKYNGDNEEVGGLTRNMFYISNTLLASYQAWTELTDFHQRYLLSTDIIGNIESTGFLFLSEKLSSNFAPNSTPLNNITKQFSFQHLDVILDTLDSEEAFPHCYYFDQVRGHLSLS